MCDWSGANGTRDCCHLLQHWRGVTDGTRAQSAIHQSSADDAASVGSADARDCSRLVEARSSAKSGLGTARTRPAWSRSERHGTVQHAHFVHDASAFPRIGRTRTCDVRGATARDDRTPSARLLDETPEICSQRPAARQNVYPLLAAIAQDTAGAGATCSVTVAGAAYPTGAGEMYMTTGAGEQRPLRAQARFTQRQV